MHPFMLHGDAIVPHTERTLSAGQVGLMNGWGVFSTLRSQGGVLFEFHRHWLRMTKDAEAMHVEMPCGEQELERRLCQLLDANGCLDATVRVVALRNHGGMWEGSSPMASSDLIAFSAPLKEWGSGVCLGVQSNARFAACEFVGAKVLAWSMNLVWLERALARGFDEVILLNEHGDVSECTSANIFAKFGKEVITPPLSAGCLPGVTRQLLVDTIRVDGYRVVEATLKVSALRHADACFITSTTRDVLAVRAIDGEELKQDPQFVAAYHQAFAQYLEDYVRNHPRPAKPAPRA
ncbi:MAG: aminotransferase class IV [Bryobacterales bacterium]|nr:aminotransferase class IV [Bryobacterales bacterium]